VTQVIDTASATPFGASESVLFNASGDLWVGHADGNRDLHHYGPDGTLLQQLDVPTEFRGSDWIDLAVDQTTLFYTSEGRRILRYDLAGEAPLGDFAVLPGFGVAYAVRLLPPGDGSGGLLVADSAEIKRLDGNGNVVATYDAPGEDTWFAVGLDPDGASFWSADFTTSNFYRFDIASTDVVSGPTHTGTPSATLFGLCVAGEPTAALFVPHVVLASFEATPGDGSVLLEWTTEHESGNAGFYVVRRDAVSGAIVRPHKGLVPSAGEVPEGADYTFTDDTAINGVEVAYHIVHVDAAGGQTEHPPRAVVVNPPRPPIRLLAPPYGSIVAPGETPDLRWEPQGIGGAFVVVSPDPRFTDDDRVLALRSDPGVRMLNKAQAARVQALAAAYPGPLYWRVVRRVGNDEMTSQTFRFSYDPRVREAGARSSSARGDR
jgi:hypothetical protein